MRLKNTNTQACKKAIKISKKIIPTINKPKKIIPTKKIFDALNSKNQKKLNNIFNSKCPANKLANKRKDKLNKRTIYEINSRITNKKSIITGTPCGKKILKNDQRRCSKLNHAIPLITKNAKNKVNKNELVKVYVYGSSPIKLLKKIKINKQKKNAKKACCAKVKKIKNNFLKKKK